ncbi:hypothetical protein [Atopomonas hussainii]|uniref:hypothetical protein n=1 Tax=Atopomonas hussainii TaxID=1429083 RepID=UPI0015876163|nr:hypothetical protein [Atopomonas hussainii]
MSLFLLEVTVLFNEHKTGPTSQILVHIPAPIEVGGYFFGGYKEGTIKKNKEASREILSLKKIVEIPEFIENALESWINAPE